MPAAEERSRADEPRGDGRNEPTRVLIVEDHRVVAEGLAALINDESDMQVVGNVGSVAETAQAASDLNPDVVLLDFRLPDGTGPDAAAAIRAVQPAAKMIFLTREDTDAARFAAVQSGASAFLHKSRAAAEVVAAIRDVARGRMLITPRTIATLLAKRRAIEAQLERLTPREKEALRLMAEGLSSRSIAAELGISYTTVRTHIRGLGSKLAVHSKLEAIVKAGSDSPAGLPDLLGNLGKRIVFQAASIASALGLEAQSQPANDAWAQVDRELTDAAPLVPLFVDGNAALLSPRVRHYEVSIPSGPMFAEAWLH